MDARTQRPRHRASTEPFVAKDGHIVERHIGDSDIAILKLFARHRHLSAPYVAALLKRSEQGISRRLRALKESDVELLKISEPQIEDKNLLRFGFLYYDLAPKGITALFEEGVTVPVRRSPSNFTHALMIEQIIASLAIGFRDRTDISLRYFEELLPSMPKPTRESKHPLRIHVDKNAYVMADYPPFAVERTSDGKRRHVFLEADTGSEPINTYDRERSGICNKFAQYIHIIENELVERQFGFSSYLFAFVTRNGRRMESMMQALHEMTERKPSLRRYFIFKTHPTLKSPENPRATGHMLTEAWKVVGNPDLTLGGERVGRPDIKSESAYRSAGGD